MKANKNKSSKIIKLNGNYSLPELMTLIRENATEYFKREHMMTKQFPAQL